jgi:4a-hydroxytetrahydrobiopterin dehydratase
MNGQRMDTPLHLQHCRPLRGSEHRLTPQQTEALLAMLSGWEVSEHGQALLKIVPFDNYHQTMAFVNALAYIAHQQDHHPDLGVHYNRCEIRFSTHDVGGLSLNDFICAAKADTLLAG